jgi:plastocyanin
MLIRLAAAAILAVFAWPGFAPAESTPDADSSSILSPNDIAVEEEVRVRIQGRKFIPSTVRVHAGKHTKLVFQNQDAELHAFVPGALFNGVSMNVGGNGAPEFGEQGFRKVIIPGEGLVELRFVLQQPGSYPYICDMPGHEMRATIVVE